METETRGFRSLFRHVIPDCRRKDVRSSPKHRALFEHDLSASAPTDERATLMNDLLVSEQATYNSIPRRRSWVIKFRDSLSLHVVRELLTRL